MINDAKHLFVCLLAISLSFLVKCVLLSFFYFLIRLVLFVCFTVEFWKFFTYSRCKPFVEYVVCKYCHPICSLSFYPLHRVFHKANTFNFDEVYNIFSSEEPDKSLFPGAFLQFCVYEVLYEVHRYSSVGVIFGKPIIQAEGCVVVIGVYPWEKSSAPVDYKF